MAVGEGWQRMSASAGLIGVSIISLGSIAAAVAYVGNKGEPFSPLNHWVSELGEVGVSELSTVFNVSLILGGIEFVIFMIGLAATRGGLFALLYGLVGVVAGIGGIFVGVYPMNNLDRHGIAALTFFILGWVVVGLASIDFVRRPDERFPRWLAVIGALTVVFFAGFLYVLLPLIASGDGLAAPEIRPDIWIVPILEWAVLIGILAWVLAASWTWWRHIRA